MSNGYKIRQDVGTIEPYFVDATGQWRYWNFFHKKWKKCPFSRETEMMSPITELQDGQPPLVLTSWNQVPNDTYFCDNEGDLGYKDKEGKAHFYHETEWDIFESYTRSGRGWAFIILPDVPDTPYQGFEPGYYRNEFNGFLYHFASREGTGHFLARGLSTWIVACSSFDSYPLTGPVELPEGTPPAPGAKPTEWTRPEDIPNDTYFRSGIGTFLYYKDGNGKVLWTPPNAAAFRQALEGGIGRGPYTLEPNPPLTYNLPKPVTYSAGEVPRDAYFRLEDDPIYLYYKDDEGTIWAIRLKSGGHWFKASPYCTYIIEPNPPYTYTPPKPEPEPDMTETKSTIALSELPQGATFRRPAGTVIYRKAFMGCGSQGADRNRSLAITGKDIGKLFPIQPDCQVVPVFTKLTVVQ